MMSGNSKLITDLAAKKLQEYDKSQQEKRSLQEKRLPQEKKPLQETKPEIKPIVYAADSVEAPKASEDINLQEKLKEAVIWSEILGKPLSRRRKRR